MAYFIRHPKTKKWDKIDKKFKTVFDLMEAHNADGIISPYQVGLEMDKWNEGDTYVVCSEDRYRFRKEIFLSYFTKSKVTAESWSVLDPLTAEPEGYSTFDTWIEPETKT